MGITTAVVDAGRILLIKREDFKVWRFPGGPVEAGDRSAKRTSVKHGRKQVSARQQGTVGAPHDSSNAPWPVPVSVRSRQRSDNSIRLLLRAESRRRQPFLAAK